MRTQMIILQLRAPDVPAVPAAPALPGREERGGDRLGLVLDLAASLAIILLCVVSALEVLGGI